MYTYMHSVMTLVFAIVLGIILSQDIFSRTKSENIDRAYRHLLIWSIFFIALDTIWSTFLTSNIGGVLLLKLITTLYYVSVVITAYISLDYIIEYFNGRLKQKVLIKSIGIVAIVAQLLVLVINQIYPFIFDVTDNGEFIPAKYRILAFVFSFIVYLMIAIIVDVFAIREKNKEVKKDYLALVSFLSIMAVCTILQYIFPTAPYCSIGDLLGCCIIHVFIVTREQAKRQEELAFAKSQADLANSSKTKFLFNMSHDIRTPMNAIIGFTNLLEKHLDDKEKSEDYIEKIQTSSDYLLSLINNVLEMARIESGKATLSQEVWSIKELIDTLDSIFVGEMKKKSLYFTKSINYEHNNIYTDKTKLREVFLNILSNAVKYTQDGGSIHLAVDEINSDSTNYATFRFVISDTGIGMSKEFLPHVFEEFTREKTTTESKIVGTGLGMPITKKIIDLMGGSVVVQSELGKGTSFSVILTFKLVPSSVVASIEKEKQEALGADFFKGKRILLAEDNDLNAEIATEVLEEEGFVVERAQDGLDVIKKIRGNEVGYFDVVLMDIQMPNMDGYEATKTIRRMNSQKREIPIIAMTANAFDEDKKNALNAGMNGHVAKPINVKLLMQTLKQILEK